MAQRTGAPLATIGAPSAAFKANRGSSLLPERSWCVSDRSQISGREECRLIFLLAVGFSKSLEGPIIGYRFFHVVRVANEAVRNSGTSPEMRHRPVLASDERRRC